MRILLVIAVALSLSGLCLLALGEPVQFVGGEYARSWLNNFMAYNEPPVKADMTNDLWTWGGVPQGKAVVDGRLVSLNNTTTIINRSGDWLGETPLTKPTWIGPSNPSSVFSPLYLSSDPWIRAQQLGLPLYGNPGDYPEYVFPLDD
jgi:hypothetical protein